VFQPLLGSGVFAADGEKENLRALQMDFFSSTPYRYTHRRTLEVSILSFFICNFYSIHDIRFHRSMTRPFLTKDRISHFENFDRHADEAIHQLKTRLNEGYAVDIQVRVPPLPNSFFSHPSIHIFITQRT
jgi:hypothetical protein